MLADEQALHLLPLLRLLPGPAAAYLCPPEGGAAAGGFGRACFGAAPGGGAGSSRRQELDLYVKLLSQGALERCLATPSGSSLTAGSTGGEGNGNDLRDCSAAVPLVLHRLACACFPDAAPGGSSGGQHVQQVALLCTILQSEGGSGSSELQRLLAMLLRWDAAAQQPSDAISQQRVQAVEAACVAAGVDAAQVLHAGLEA